MGTGLICFVMFSAAGQPAAEPKASAPAASITTTNSARLNRLQRLEDDLTRAIKRMFTSDDLDPTRRRPAPVVRIQPPLKKDSEDKRDWMNLDPSQGFGMQDSSQAKDLKQFFDEASKQENRLRDDAILEYYKSQDPSKRKSDLEMSSQDPILGNASSWLKNQQRDQTPSDVLANEEKLRSILQESGSGLAGILQPSSVQSAPGGVFGFAPAGPRDAGDFRKKENPYLQEYRNFMAPGSSPPPNDVIASVLGSAAKGLNPFETAVRAPVISLEPLPTIKRDSILGQQFGNINPVTTPTLQLDPTISVVNKWNPFFTPNPVVPTTARAAAPPQPSFDAPRRKF